MLRKALTIIVMACAITMPQNIDICNVIKSMPQKYHDDTLMTETGVPLLTKTELFGCSNLSLKELTKKGIWTKGKQGYKAIGGTKYAVWANVGTNDSAVIYLVNYQKKFDSLWIIGTKEPTPPYPPACGRAYKPSQKKWITSVDVMENNLVVKGKMDSLWLWTDPAGKLCDKYVATPITWSFTVDKQNLEKHGTETVTPMAHHNTGRVSVQRGCYDLRGRKVSEVGRLMGQRLVKGRHNAIHIR